MGAAAYRFLRGMIPALESLSGTTRADLGCDGSYYHISEDADDLIAKLKAATAKVASL
jgi:hypothetical protein